MREACRQYGQWNLVIKPGERQWREWTSRNLAQHEWAGDDITYSEEYVWKKPSGAEVEGICFIKITCRGSCKMRLPDRKLESGLSKI